jgi:hypothetical protein
VLGRGGRQLPDSFFESAEPDVVGHTARRSGALEPVVHVKRYLATLYNIGDMPVRIEMQNTGDSRARGEIIALIEHVLSDRPGEWRVSIVGSRANDNWEMKVEGPEGFERSYSLVGSAGEHQPVAIGNLLGKLLPASKP